MNVGTYGTMKSLTSYKRIIVTRQNITMRNAICTRSSRVKGGYYGGHTVHALESGTCILEMKNGAYEPLSDVDILK